MMNGAKFGHRQTHGMRMFKITYFAMRFNLLKSNPNGKCTFTLGNCSMNKTMLNYWYCFTLVIAL